MAHECAFEDKVTVRAASLTCASHCGVASEHTSWIPFECPPTARAKNCSFKFSARDLTGCSLGVGRKNPEMSGVMSGS